MKKRSLAEALGGDAKGDGKIAIADLRAWMTKGILEQLPITSIQQLAKIFKTSTRSLYDDREREIPEILLTTKHSHKRIRVDLSQPA